MPSGLGISGRRAVAWNGLTYDVVSDSGPADLQANINALINQRSARPESGFSRIERLLLLGRGFIADWRAVELTAASLVLRLGEAGMAGRCYWAARSEATDYQKQKNDAKIDPLLELSANWIGAIYDRTVL